MKYKDKVTEQLVDAVQWRANNDREVKAWLKLHYPNWSAQPNYYPGVNVLVTPPGYDEDLLVKHHDWWIVANNQRDTVLRLSDQAFKELYEEDGPNIVRAFECPFCAKINTYTNGQPEAHCHHNTDFVSFDNTDMVAPVGVLFRCDVTVAPIESSDRRTK